MQWRIQLLRELRAAQGDREIARFRTRKTGALLAYLAYHCDRSHARDVLVELLWPQSEPGAGRHSLRMALSWLRHQLEPPGVPAGTVLIADRASVRLNPPTVTTDVAEFEAALNTAAHASDATGRRQSLTQAVELYRGELLSGYYEEWILPEQQRLAELYFGAVRQLIRHLVDIGELDQAIQLACRAVSADRLREEAHAELIHVYAAAGQPRAALCQYQELERLLQQELGQSPSASTRDIATSIAAQLTAAPREKAEGGPSHLPIQLTRFFGREQEIARLREMLLPQSNTDHGLATAPHRLVTLTGPGGSGKSRLALAVAERLLEQFRGAVWFVALADVGSAERIPDAVRDALRLPPLPDAEPLDQVAAALARQPALLVLDNLEHLLTFPSISPKAAGGEADGASVVRALLERVPTLACLITSRQRLNLVGEREFAVRPLPVPDAAGTPEALAGCESVQLFLDRAQAVRPDLKITPANALAISELCRRLDGIPLAVELAAARARVLTPAQMLEPLRRRFDFLVSRQRDTVERHRTLRAAIDWSYRLLSPDLQRFFARLSVFRGGWNLEAAQAVCVNADPAVPGLALDYMEQLRECSLVEIEERGDQIRYRLLETLREYAQECLAASGDAEALRRQHGFYFLALAEESNRRGEETYGECGWEEQEQERENLLAALDRGAEAGEGLFALRLAGALLPLWWERGRLTEGRDYLARVLSLESAQEHTAARCQAINLVGMLTGAQGDRETEQQCFEEHLRLQRSLNDKRGIAYALSMLGHAARGRQDFTSARAFFEQSRAIHRELGDQVSTDHMIGQIGKTLAAEGSYTLARPYLEENLAACQRMGCRHGVSSALRSLAQIDQAQGDLQSARERLTESLALLWNVGNRRYLPDLLIPLASLAAAQGQAARAARLFGATEALCEAMGMSPRSSQQREYASYRSRCVAAGEPPTNEETFAAAWAEGQAMSLEQAVTYALEASDSPAVEGKRPQ